MVGRPQISPAHPVHGPRDRHRGRARQGLHATARPARSSRSSASCCRSPPSRVAPAVGRREPAVLHLVRPARAARSQRLPHLRAAHGAAGVLERLYPLFTCVRTWSPFFAVACLGLSACGSDDAAHDVVPAALPELTRTAGRRRARADLDGHVEHVERHHLHRPDRHHVHRPDPDAGPGLGGHHDRPDDRRRRPRRAAPAARGRAPPAARVAAPEPATQRRHGRRVAGRVQPVLQGQPGRLLVGLGGERRDYEGLHLDRADLGPRPDRAVPRLARRRPRSRDRTSPRR